MRAATGALAFEAGRAANVEGLGLEAAGVESPGKMCQAGNQPWQRGRFEVVFFLLVFVGLYLLASLLFSFGVC